MVLSYDSTCAYAHPSATVCGPHEPPHHRNSYFLDFYFCLVICFYFLMFLLWFVGFSFPVLMWFYFVVETFAIGVHSSSSTNFDQILFIPPYVSCYSFLVEVWEGLRDLLRFVPFACFSYCFMRPLQRTMSFMVPLESSMNMFPILCHHFQRC